MDTISALRKTTPWEEFDYQSLLQSLNDYSHPRDKITDLLAKGIIVRFKKGLDVFGDAYRSKRPYLLYTAVQWLQKNRTCSEKLP